MASTAAEAMNRFSKPTAQPSKVTALEAKPTEQAKIKCAKKLFNEISITVVKYHDLDS